MGAPGRRQLSGGIPSVVSVETHRSLLSLGADAVSPSRVPEFCRETLASTLKSARNSAIMVMG
jgi:hypothetical protein